MVPAKLDVYFLLSDVQQFVARRRVHAISSITRQSEQVTFDTKGHRLHRLHDDDDYHGVRQLQPGLTF